MGGNQSKTYTENDFTFEQSYKIMHKVQTDVNTFMSNNATAIAEATASGITIDGNKGGEVNIKVASTAEIEVAQEIAASLETISKDDVSGLVALDVLNAIKNANKQDISATVANKSESTVISDTEFNIDTCVEVCNQLSACIEIASTVIAQAKSTLNNVRITNNEDTKINLEVVSSAKNIATQLTDFIDKAANEIKNNTELNAKFTNNMDVSTEQNQEMLKNIADQMSAVAQKITEEVGSTARSWADKIGDVMKNGIWMLLIPIILIVLIGGLVILPKLLPSLKSKKGGKNNGW